MNTRPLQLLAGSAVITLSALGTLTCLTALIQPALAAEKVVASIKPIQSLVAGVMEGVGTPDIIVDGANSPHTFAMKPSTAEALQNANVVFWVGPDLEAFLVRPLETLGSNAKSVELGDAPGVEKLPMREGGTFEPHEHEGEEAHEHGHDHGHEEMDPHIWLDPVNAKAMVAEISATLSTTDPQNAATYKANADKLTHKLDDLQSEIQGELSSVADKPFIVFHDGYQYFEHRFGLQAAGSITVSPEVMPGARRVSEVEEKVKSLQATCIFSEPQFQPKLIEQIAGETSAKSASLDPLGADLSNGSNLYFTLMKNLAKSVHDCLG